MTGTVQLELQKARKCIKYFSFFALHIISTAYIDRSVMTSEQEK